MNNTPDPIVAHLHECYKAATRSRRYGAIRTAILEAAGVSSNTLALYFKYATPMPVAVRERLAAHFGLEYGEVLISKTESQYLTHQEVSGLVKPKVLATTLPPQFL